MKRDHLRRLTQARDLIESVADVADGNRDVILPLEHALELIRKAQDAVEEAIA